ncbi:MAG: hypothetical protein ABWJ42_00630, partial [Sulfolobales archaeon]
MLSTGRYRKTAIILTTLLIATLVVVNATVFAYRWLEGTINVADKTAASGAACVGFYSSSDQQGIILPTAGTNYNTQTYDGNSISVTPSNPVCQWTVDSITYSLYEGISVTVPITIGTWYIKDFYGFGYKGTASDPTVYVYIKVES